MATGNPSDMSGRVNALIERFFGGNRSAAARMWRVPQPTVQRLAVGDTEMVRAATLAKIAATHDTSVDWLLSGRGPDPLATEQLPYVEYRDFEDLVNGLGLSAKTRLAVLDLPKTTSTAHTVLCHWGTMLPEPPRLQPDEVRQVALDARYKAAALQFVSWGYLFDGLIKAYGPQRVRDKLESEYQRIRLGFHPVPMELIWIPEAKPVLATLEARFEQRGEGPAGTLLIDGPTLPALDTLPDTPKRGRPSKLGTTRRKGP